MNIIFFFSLCGNFFFSLLLVLVALTDNKIFIEANSWACRLLSLSSWESEMLFLLDKMYRLVRAKQNKKTYTFREEWKITLNSCLIKWAENCCAIYNIGTFMHKHHSRFGVQVIDIEPFFSAVWTFNCFPINKTKWITSTCCQNGDEKEKKKQWIKKG